MICGIGREAAVFLYAGLSGMALLLVYQVLTCLRQVIRHSSLAVGVEDFIFWIGTSVYLFRQMYKTTYGSVRWFFILGVAAGVLAEYSCAILLKKICRMMKKKLEKYGKNR